MWARTGGRGTPTKVRAVQSAIEAAYSDPKARTPATAVYGFGYRRRGSCGRFETVSEFSAERNNARIIEAVGRYNPQGRGPIAEAMRAAGEALKSQSAPRHMLVIHDDGDNCRGDPCALARELKSAMPDLKIHALTLREPQANRAKSLYACFRDFTGGEVVQTLDADEITAATVRLVSLAGRGSRPQSVAHSQSDSHGDTAKQNLTVTSNAPTRAGVTYRDGPTGLVVAGNLAAAGPRFTGGIHWRLTKRADGADRLVGTEFADTAVFKVQPGRYTVIAETDTATVRETVRVRADKLAVYVADLKGGAISFNARLGERGPQVDDVRIAVRKTNKDGLGLPGAPHYIGTTGRGALFVADGSYLVTARKGALEETIRLDVAAGADQKVDMQLPGARLQVSVAPPPTLAPQRNSANHSRATPNADRSDANRIKLAPEITVARRAEPADPSADQSRGTPTAVAASEWQEIARAKAFSQDFYVRPGTYRVSARSNTATVTREITVSTGQSETVPISIQTTQISLSTGVSGDALANLTGKIHYRITRLDGPVGQRDRRVIYDDRALLSLTPGRYRIDSIIDEPFSRSSQTLVVVPGQSQSVVMTHNVGRVVMRMVSSARGHRTAATDWVIRKNRTGAAVWRGIGPTSVALLPPGRYVLEANGNREKFRTLNVAAGKTETVSLIAR